MLTISFIFLEPGLFSSKQSWVSFCSLVSVQDGLEHHFFLNLIASMSFSIASFYLFLVCLTLNQLQQNFLPSLGALSSIIFTTCPNIATIALLLTPLSSPTPAILRIVLLLMPSLSFIPHIIPYILADRSHHHIGHSISFVLKKFNLELTRA